MKINIETPTLLDAKEYLNQARLLDQRISAKLDRVARLRSLTEKVTATIGPEVRSGARNVTTLENRIIRLVAAEDDLNADIDRLVDLKQEISDTISRIGDPDSQLLLELRYLCFRNWNEIAGVLGYHVRTVQRLHGRALRELAQIMKTDMHTSGYVNGKPCHDRKHVL